MITATKGSVIIVFNNNPRKKLFFSSHTKDLVPQIFVLPTICYKNKFLFYLRTTNTAN